MLCAPTLLNSLFSRKVDLKKIREMIAKVMKYFHDEEAVNAKTRVQFEFFIGG